VQPGSGAALRMLAAAVGARAVVEVGTGTGVSGMWLLRGMRPDGVLTTVDLEPEHQRAARETFAAGGIPANRTRVIPGRGLDVLSRLADASYDMMFCATERSELEAYFETALRLLRIGGLVVFDNALWRDQVADPAQCDPETTAVREFGRSVRRDDRVVPCLLPTGDGLLCAVKL
jgi:predicted O-methyltransferase YrrM